MLIDKIASDLVLETAYQWMCEQRAHHHSRSTVEHFIPFYSSDDSADKLFAAHQHKPLYY